MGNLLNSERVTNNVQQPRPVILVDGKWYNSRIDANAIEPQDYELLIEDETFGYHYTLYIGDRLYATVISHNVIGWIECGIRRLDLHLNNYFADKLTNSGDHEQHTEFLHQRGLSLKEYVIAEDALTERLIASLPHHSTKVKSAN